MAQFVIQYILNEWKYCLKYNSNFCFYQIFCDKKWVLFSLQLTINCNKFISKLHFYDNYINIVFTITRGYCIQKIHIIYKTLERVKESFSLTLILLFIHFDVKTQNNYYLTHNSSQFECFSLYLTLLLLSFSLISYLKIIFCF